MDKKVECFLYGVPRGFDMFPYCGTAHPIVFSNYSKSQKITDMEILRIQDSVYYTLRKSGFAANDYRRGGVFGMTVKTNGSYIDDPKLLWDLFNAVWEQIIIKEGVMLEKIGEGTEDEALKFKFDRFKDIQKYCDEVRAVILNKIAEKFNVKPLAELPPWQYTGRVVRLNSETSSNEDIINALSRVGDVEISPEYGIKKQKEGPVEQQEKKVEQQEEPSKQQEKQPVKKGAIEKEKVKVFLFGVPEVFGCTAKSDATYNALMNNYTPGLSKVPELVIKKNQSSVEYTWRRGELISGISRTGAVFGMTVLIPEAYVDDPKSLGEFFNAMWEEVIMKDGVMFDKIAEGTEKETFAFKFNDFEHISSYCDKVKNIIRNNIVKNFEKKPLVDLPGQNTGRKALLNSDSSNEEIFEALSRFGSVAISPEYGVKKQKEEPVEQEEPSMQQQEPPSRKEDQIRHIQHINRVYRNRPLSARTLSVLETFDPLIIGAHLDVFLLTTHVDVLMHNGLDPRVHIPHSRHRSFSSTFYRKYIVSTIINNQTPPTNEL